MSNNIPEMTIGGVWTDIYAVTGITASSDLILLNKSSSTMYVYVSPTMPGVNSFDGWLLSTTFPGNWTTVTSVPIGSKVWVKGSGKLLAQLFD